MADSVLSRMTLRLKLLLVFIFVTLAPVAVMSGVSYVIVRQLLADGNKQLLVNQVNSAYQFIHSRYRDIYEQYLENDQLGIIYLQESAKNNVNAIKIGKRGYIFILNENNELVVHPEMDEDGFQKPAFIESVGKNIIQSDLYLNLKIDQLGAKKIAPEYANIYVMTFAQWKWKIGAVQFESDFDDSLTTMKLTMTFLALISLLIAALFGVFGPRVIIQPLSNMLKSIVAGEKITVQVQDEIGNLARWFNEFMTKENLHKKELQEKIEIITHLKQQQDGDYYLTTLLYGPLATNLNNSKTIETICYSEQKKKFVFRGNEHEIGGDLNITANIQLGEDLQSYTVILNADAMGKSIQGAGGALVLGTAMHNILARNQIQRHTSATKPEEWMQMTYTELTAVFRTFNGSMLASINLVLINEKTNLMYYLNAEHPHGVLYRDGKASFIEEDLMQRKLGTPEEFELAFSIHQLQLQPGDILFLGTDGRDDLMLPHGEDFQMNEDEFLFLRQVESSNGELTQLIDRIKKSGQITDDFSIVQIIITDPERLNRENFHIGYAAARKAIKADQIENAIEHLNKLLIYDYKKTTIKLMLGILFFRKGDCAESIKYFTECTEDSTTQRQAFLYLALAHRNCKEIETALYFAKKALTFDAKNIKLLLLLADLQISLGNNDLAKSYVDQAEEIQPDSVALERLKGRLSLEV